MTLAPASLGSGKWYFIYQPLGNEQGNTQGILAFILDMTDQVLARRKVEERAEELKRL